MSGRFGCFLGRSVYSPLNWSSVLSSVNASDKPVHIFLRFTALFTIGLILIAQALVKTWLYVDSRKMLRAQIPGTMNTISMDYASL